MGTEDYVVWTHKTEDRACVLHAFVGFDDSYLLKEGTRVAESFPDDVHFTMSPEFPKDTLLVDSLLNSDDEIVASERLMELLREISGDSLEFLPVRILDHDERAVDDPYFIVNVLSHVDCLDLDASGATPPDIPGGWITSSERLVLDPARVDDSSSIFRVADYPSATLVKKSVADDISARGFTGIQWVELGKFKGGM